MPDDPRISVIIPACNSALFLSETLASLLKQSFNRWECVVVDDGSTDQTASIATSFADGDSRIRSFSIPNQGVANARNFGFSKSLGTTDYIVFLDHDDCFLPNAFDRMIQVADREVGCIGVHALPDTIDLQGNPYEAGRISKLMRDRRTVQNSKFVARASDQPTDLGTLMTTGFCPPALFMTRRRIAERIGGFNQLLAPADDRDYWIRACRLGNYAFIDEVLILYRRHPAAGLNNVRLCDQKIRETDWVNFFSPDNTPAQRRVFKDYYTALQRSKWREKSERCQAAWDSGRVGEAARLATQAMGRMFKYLRGYPTKRG